MNQGQYVFSQLVGHLDRNHFNYLARKYDGNKYVKHFSCWNQLLAMMFGQLSNRESLRDEKNVLTDAEVKLTGYLSEKKYPESFRLIRYYDEEDDREFTFLTNAKQLSALDVANLYKKRWLVELFFKWLKQHLKIKRFWGTTENAVRIQISVAIITYCLVAIVQHDMRLERSTYEVLQILSISLTDKTHLRDLFDKTNFNDVKDQFGPLIPGLSD